MSKITKVIPFCPECKKQYFYPVDPERTTYCPWCAKHGDSVALIDTIPGR